MKDFLTFTLHEYYKSIGWWRLPSKTSNGGGFEYNEDYDTYSNLSALSKGILDFDSPNGFLVSIGKSISPLLRSSYSLGIHPNIRSAGFMFTSTPLNLAPYSLYADRSNHTPPTSTESNETITTQTKSLSIGKATWMTHYLLYGRIFEDMRLEALYSQSITSRDMLVISGLSHWNNETPQLAAQFTHKGDGWCVEGSYTSEDHIFGLNGLFNLGDTGLSAGGEIYYTAKENSGGMSFGARYAQTTKEDDVDSVVTFIANPMMGFLNTTFSSKIMDNLSMSTAYDFNVYSFDSDVSVGLHYAQKAASQVMKARFSLNHGIGLKLEGAFNRAFVGIGFMTELTANPKRSFGVELTVV